MWKESFLAPWTEPICFTRAASRKVSKLHPNSFIRLSQVGDLRKNHIKSLATEQNSSTCWRNCANTNCKSSSCLLELSVVTVNYWMEIHKAIFGGDSHLECTFFGLTPESWPKEWQTESKWMNILSEVAKKKKLFRENGPTQMMWMDITMDTLSRLQRWTLRGTRLFHEGRSWMNYGTAQRPDFGFSNVAEKRLCE